LKSGGDVDGHVKNVHVPNLNGSSPLQTNIKYPPRCGNIMEDYAKQYFFKVCHEAVTNRQALVDQQVRVSLDIVVRSCFFRNDRPMISHHAP